MEQTIQVLLIFVFGISALFFVFITIWKKNQGFGPNNLRALVLVTVATFATIVFILDPNKSDAVFGLLGAIAGYVFGIGISKES